MEYAARIPLVRRKRKKPWSPYTKWCLMWVIWNLVFAVWNAVLVTDERVTAWDGIRFGAMCLHVYLLLFWWKRFMQSYKRDQEDD